MDPEVQATLTSTLRMHGPGTAPAANSRLRLAVGSVTLLVLALRLWFGVHNSFCGTPDACYYLGMARGLEVDHAFRVPFLFDLQLPHLAVPNTGIEYWRPGVSFLLLLTRPFGLASVHSGMVLATLCSVLFALAARQMARQAGLSERAQLASFLLCLLLPDSWIGSLTADSGLFYGTAVAWFLAWFTVRRGGLGQDLAALACVGAAYAIRNDAGLLLIPLGGVLFLRHRRSERGGSPGYALAMLAGFGAALLPMHLLYRHVLGAWSPPGTVQTLWLDDLSDFVAYRAPVSVHTLLAHGARHLLLQRLATPVLILYRLLALSVGYAALVFLPALWTQRAGGPAAEGSAPTEPLPEYAGAAMFAITLLLVYGALLPAIGIFSALRSATGLLPLVSVLTVVAISRVARSRQLASTLTAAVLVVYLVSGIMDDRRALDPMNAIAATDHREADALRTLGATPGGSTSPASSGRNGALVMVADPVQFSVTTGLSTVPLPGNGVDAVLAEARDLHATHAILDSEHVPGVPGELLARLHPRRTLELPAEHALLLELTPEPPQR